MDDFKQQLGIIKSSYNIVDLIQEENVPLKNFGPNKYKGLCPFHTEKTPSFIVDENFQTYRCFGCGKHGDIFSFIQEIRGCEFKDAVLYLAKMKGITISFSKSNKSGKSEGHSLIDLKKLYNLLEDSYKFYRNEFDQLPQSHPAKQEILKRGLSVDNPVFCYAPERYGALVNYLDKKGYTKDIMLSSQLVSEKNGKYYDFFYGRLMITLSDFSGRPVSYSARKLFDSDNRAKYVNGKQSPVFQKKGTLFNLDKAKKSIRESKSAIVCEGPFDVLALEASGIHNAVASCGTAFTEEQLRNLEQLIDVDGSLIFSFDGDMAGIQAAVKTFLHFPIVHGNSSVVLFPENLDPCDYLIKYGPDKMNEPFKDKKPIIDFVIDAIATRLKLTDMQSRYKFASLIMGKYAPAVTDKALQDYLLRRVSVMSGIEISELKPMIGRKPRKYVHTSTSDDDSKKNNIEIEINNTLSDRGYISALSMLIRNPKLLFKDLKNTKIPDKYHTFIRELLSNCQKFDRDNKQIHIIPEQYSEPNFVLYLETVNVMIDYNNSNEVENNFKNLLKISEMNLKKELNHKKNLSISQALSQAKSKEEILELLKLGEKQ